MLLDHFTGKIFLTSLLFIALTVAVDCKWGVLPIGGLILLIYVLLVFCLTVWLTSNLMRRILSQNRPIVYDFQNNPYLSYAKRCYLSFKVRPSEDGRAETPATARRPKNIDERIDDFTEDVEAFVRRWFGPISRDGLFPRETRGLVDDIVRRFLQVAVEVDGKRLSHGVLVILLNHAKEYQRTVRRQKRKSGSIEDLYRYAHVASNNAGTFEHVIRQLTGKLLRQFIGWEVYSSVPCKAVASVLAKKLTAPLLIHVSSPPFINHKLASICRTSLELDPYDAVSLSDVDLSETVLTETADRTNLAPLGESLRSESNTPKVSPKRFDGADSASVLDETITEVDDGKAISPPVKIHESRSSTKTWRNSSDLECISLGQDLLVGQDFADPDSDIQNLIGKKLWKDSSGDFLESEDKPPPAQPLFEEPIDLAKDLIANIPSATIPSFISNTIKPIGNVTLQELQQTTVNSVVRPVSSAMHRIGDLQDEAAGMMEGIFDLGMAGIRRGLRLTGLQDGDRLRADPTRSKPVSAEPSPDGRAKRLSRAAPVGSEDSLRSEETVWTNPLTRDSPDFDGQILLERPAPSVAVEDLDGSPDPEYEDATDLATTTAKLRSLLQQKTTESNLTTPAVSPM